MDTKDDLTPRGALSRADEPVASVSRTTFNYLLIAFVSLAVGLALGYFGYERIVSRVEAQTPQVDTEALIAQAVATALAALPQGALESAAAQPLPVVDTEGKPARGPADAPITLVEFGDFRCGFCKRFHDETITPLFERFPDQIRLVYRDYPVLGPDSLAAALAAQCAHDQGVFWEYHDLLFAAPDQLNRDAFLRYAEQLNLDLEAFTPCYDDQTHRATVVRDYVDGQNLGVSGTPTFFINGRILIGAQPLDSFVLQIESLLAEIERAETAS